MLSYRDIVQRSIIRHDARGIGSEGVASIGKSRRYIGTELHPIYWRQGVKNLQAAKPEITDLFAGMAA